MKKAKRPGYVKGLGFLCVCGKSYLKAGFYRNHTKNCKKWSEYRTLSISLLEAELMKGKSIQAAAEILNVNYNTAKYWLAKGWPKRVRLSRVRLPTEAQNYPYTVLTIKSLQAIYELLGIVATTLSGLSFALDETAKAIKETIKGVK